MESISDKQVPGKKRDRDLFGAIMPLVTGLIERQENVKILILQDASRHFFVLMACANGIPTILDFLFCHEYHLDGYLVALSSCST